jgi:hypothetical protein
MREEPFDNKNSLFHMASFFNNDLSLTRPSDILSPGERRILR